METEAETGGRRPPAQGRTPGAPRSWKRRGGPSPGASARSPALGALDHRCLVPGTRGVWSLGLRVWGGMDVCGLKPQVSSVPTDAGSSRRLRQPQVLLDDGCS